MINPEFNLNKLPERSVKPRNSGLTMVMDKGLSCRQAEDFLEVAADKTDIIKFLKSKFHFFTSIRVAKIRHFKVS